LLLGGAAAEAAGVVPALAALPDRVQVLAVALVLASTAVAVWAQETMGAAWVADIEARGGSEQVIAGGPFAFVRNPNYCAMLAVGAGAVLLAFDAVTVLGWVVLLVSLLWTAREEEPLLRERFGEAYESYAARTGRFVPGVGRLS